VTHTQHAHGNSMLLRSGQSHCCVVARSPANVVLQTEDASDKLRDIIAPMAGGLSSALTPLKGMVRKPDFLPRVSVAIQNIAKYCAVPCQ